MGVLDDSDGGIESLWGKNSEDMFFGGALGSMAHYNGQSWKKVETGTDLDVYDIHGTEEQGVVAVAAKFLTNHNNLMVKITEDGHIEPLSTQGISYSIHGVWIDPSGPAYVIGSGIYRKPDVDFLLAWNPIHEEITNNYMFAIDAIALNDIAIAGAFGEVLHFNGAQWRSFHQQISGSIYDVKISGDVIAAIGYDGRQGFISIGRRE